MYIFVSDYGICNIILYTWNKCNHRTSKNKCFKTHPVNLTLFDSDTDEVPEIAALCQAVI